MNATTWTSSPCTHIPSVWGLPASPQPHPLGHHRAPSWAPYARGANSMCPTLWNAVDCRLPGSFDHGIWVVISFSRGSSRLRDWTHVSWVFCTGRQALYQATWEAPGFPHLSIHPALYLAFHPSSFPLSYTWSCIYVNTTLCICPTLSCICVFTRRFL